MAFEKQYRLPVTRFDTRQVEATYRFDAWRDNMGVLFDLSDPEGGTPPSDVMARIDACNLGGAIFGTTQAQTQLFQRDARRVARDDMDHILVQVFLSGGGISGGHQEIVAGDMLIIDLDQPHHMVNSDFKNLTLLMPRELDPALSDLLAPLHGNRLGRDNPMVRFMGEHMIALWRHVPDMEIAQAGGALQGTFGLMRNWLTRERPLGDEDSPDVSVATGKAICRFIESHLADPLPPELLAKTFRISRSQIYRIFAPYGGVAHYVTERRLRRSLRMLTHSAFNHMSISAIGFACGFSSESHFSRTFRTRYGTSPSQTRAAGLNGDLGAGTPRDSSVDYARDFAEWVRELGATTLQP